jgi:hypothetical protein
MTDQDLLELAAKAAGLTNVEFHDIGVTCGMWNSSMTDYWNPLKNDSDALRLAVKLGMEVYVDNHPDGCECTEVRSITFPKSGRVIVNHEDDAHSATRRAIVIAAAEIGKI